MGSEDFFYKLINNKTRKYIDTIEMPEMGCFATQFKYKGIILHIVSSIRKHNNVVLLFVE